MAKVIVVYFMILFSHLLFAQTPKVFINEFVSFNEYAPDNTEFDNYVDWIEIYNDEDVSINLSSFYLTDNLSNPVKWAFPSGTVIPAKGYLIIFADGEDEGLHTNFQLSRDGEQIGLYTNDDLFIDSLTFTRQNKNVSYGRSPDDMNNWVYFPTPTPMAANSTSYFNGISSKPIISVSTGFYSGNQSLSITSTTAEKIYYTTDGSTPDQTDNLYSGPITVSQTTLVRAVSFNAGLVLSEPATSMIFINEETSLPVVSVITEPEHLFDDEIGMYVEGTNGISGYCTNTAKNWNQDWERPANITLFEPDRINGFEINAGIKIGGGCTRKYPQKSLAVYARSEYGESKINYQIFADKEINEFNNFILRNSGQDYYRAIFRDGMMHTLVQGLDIDYQSYKPAIVFINGEYWGIHGIREKHNEHYIASNHNIDPDDIDILTGNKKVMQGTDSGYEEILAYAETHDLSDENNWSFIEDRIDVNEYLNYIISEIYFANVDWPSGNIKYWKKKGEGNKWRWILFDTDLGYGAHDLGEYNSNTLANVTSETQTYYANPTWSTFLIRSLLKNQNFQNRFIQRSSVLMNTVFHKDRSLAIIDSIKAMLAPEVPRHIDKWPDAASFGNSWDELVEITRTFAINRVVAMRSHITEKFSLNGLALLNANVDDATRGYIEIENQNVGSSYSGPQYKDIPIKIKAIAKPGYSFSHWGGDISSTTNSIEVTITESTSIEAVFKQASLNDYEGLVLNEFMAWNNSTIEDENNNYEDWIELYNGSDKELSLSSIYLTDDLQTPDKFSLGQMSKKTLLPGEFLLLWADDELDEGDRHMPFRLNSDGESIGMFVRTENQFSELDAITFTTQLPDVSYGRKPDGSGDWDFRTVPTPGWSNTQTDVESEATTPERFYLGQNYPNPFNPSTEFNVELANHGHVNISVFNLLGQKVAEIINKELEKGIHRFDFDASGLASGTYIYRITTENYSASRKMLYLK